jgi:hypothetical protein
MGLTFPATLLIWCFGELPSLMMALRVVNFDSDEKSDQKIDIFSANQISAFLQQLTPPFQRFFQKI